MFEVRHYLSAESGRDVFLDWLKAIRDPVAKVQIVRRVNRMELGNFGDHRFCRDGVWELRIGLGPGYRVYYAKLDREVILLLCGGDKRTQADDIERAVQYWREWQRRSSSDAR
jgi:putative addiction module killer protein